MGKEAYTSIKEYLKSVEFESPSSPEVFLDEEQGASPYLDFTTKLYSIADTSCYIVELHTLFSATAEEKDVVRIKVVYASLIKVLDQDLDEDQLRQILAVEVPQNMYDTVRVIVWNLLSVSGFPPLLLFDHDFSGKKRCSSCVSIGNCSRDLSSNNGSCACKDGDGLKVDDLDVDFGEISDLPLGYEWILKAVSFDDEVTMEVMKQCSDLCWSIDSYETLPSYLLYYRFFPPVEYRHPDSIECEPSFWSILFQLLFAEGENVEFVDVCDGVPEIEFDYSETDRRTVSSLTQEELMKVTYRLARKSFDDTLRFIVGLISDGDYAKMLPSSSILKEEFFTIFGYDSNGEGKIVDKLNEMYKRIEQYDLKSLAYRFE